jgi:threonine dehydratase
MNFDRLRLVTELADVGALREAMLATTIPERPGAFAAFLDAALPEGAGLQITEFKYRCAVACPVSVLPFSKRLY